MVLGSEPLAGRSGREAGRALLAKLYWEYTGTSLPAIAVTDRGKPYFVDGGLHFSISHTKRNVFCVLSEHPVGIDAEEADRQIHLTLAEKILSPAEKAQFDTAADKRLALLTFWVLKEARAKYTGKGLQGYPKDTAFSLDDPRVQLRDSCLVAIIEEDHYVV